MALSHSVLISVQTELLHLSICLEHLPIHVTCAPVTTPRSRARERFCTKLYPVLLYRVLHKLKCGFVDSLQSIIDIRDDTGHGSAGTNVAQGKRRYPGSVFSFQHFPRFAEPEGLGMWDNKTPDAPIAGLL